MAKKAQTFVEGSVRLTPAELKIMADFCKLLQRIDNRLKDESAQAPLTSKH